MISTPAARICGPPMPNSATSMRAFSAVASRAAYMSPEASPAERSKEMGGMKRSDSYYPTNFIRQCSGHLEVAIYVCQQQLITRRCGRRKDRRAWTRRKAIRAGELLLLVLELIQAVVNPALCQQFLVRAFFAQAPFVEYQDTVRVLDRAQAVRDNQRRAAAQQLVQRLADQTLRLGVHAR